MPGPSAKEKTPLSPISYTQARIAEDPTAEGTSCPAGQNLLTFPLGINPYMPTDFVNTKYPDAKGLPILANGGLL